MQLIWSQCGVIMNGLSGGRGAAGGKGSVRGRAGYNRERSSNNDEVVEEVATCLTQTTNTSE